MPRRRTADDQQYHTITATSVVNTTSATQSLVGCTGTADDDVWYSFTATSTTHNFAVTGGNFVHEVFSGSCTGLTSLYCSDPETSSYDCFVVGHTYYVRVYTFAAGVALTGTVGIGTNLIPDATAATSTQICAPFTFSAGQNQAAGGAGCNANYGCLTTRPNPEYHWLQVTAAGTLKYSYTSTPALDVDIAIWGPFSTPPNPNPAGCVALGGQATITGAALGAPIYCDYSNATFGTSSTLNVLAGQYYLLLITNFSNTATSVTIANAGGTATIACPTIISNVTSTPGSCASATNLYTLTGTVSYTNPPPTGTLTVSDNNGNSQVFNAPFAAGSTNYTIASNASNGASHTITAVFSASTNSARCNTYTAPAACCTVPTPTTANVSDLACGYSYDLTAAGGTTPYQWSTSTTFSPLITTLSGLRLSSPTGTATYYVRSSGQTCYNSVTVQDPTPGTGLTPGSCNACPIAESQSNTYYDAGNRIIAVVQDAPGGTALGSTSVCATVDASPSSSNVNGNMKHYMQRHFQITPATNGPATVTLYFSSAEVQALVTAAASDNGVKFTGMSNLAVFKYNGGSETPLSHTRATTIPNSSLTIAGPNSNGFYTVSFAVSGFSGFYFGAGTATPLPVHLISFEGSKAGGDNRLRWQTAEEGKGDYFIVERSDDGANWDEVGAQIAGKGANSVYSYSDAGGASATHYYRLRIVAATGDATYSKVVRLNGSSLVSTSIYPNPVSSELNLSVTSSGAANLVLSVANMLGQTVFSSVTSVPAGGTKQGIDVHALTPGVYSLKIRNASNGETSIHQFIKQ